MNNFIYTGDELQVFKLAQNWKKYYKNLIAKKILSGRILEVGAGIGEMTRVLRDVSPNFDWICIEPDLSNAQTIRKIVSNGELDGYVSVFQGNVEAYKDAPSSFSSILFIDSLEHIEKDQDILKYATGLVKTGGTIIIVVPAHNFLFNEFDKKIGHYRRYNKKMLREILPNNLSEISCKYIDSAGFFLSLANKLILKSSDPTMQQILFWDKFIVPISMKLDRLINFNFGKNLVFIAEKK